MQTTPEGYQFNQSGGIYKLGAAHSSEVRRNFLRDWQQGTAKVPELCETHGISKATGYRWIIELKELDKVTPLPRGGSDPRVLTDENLWFLDMF